MHLKFANYLQSYLVIYVETKLPQCNNIIPHYCNKVKRIKYNRSMKIKIFLKNALIILFPLICASLITSVIDTSIYNSISKPPLSPPGFIFPITWSVLYLLMGISLYLIKKEKNSRGMLLFFIQLVINLIWPIVFFSLRWFLISSLLIIWLLYFVTLMIKEFYYIKKSAAYLQLPYLIWLIFALYLNIGIVILN